MELSQRTLEKLRILINEETEYRSGPKLVSFFNELGFNDVYGQGFPSRWMFTDEKLSKLNGTADLDKCIKKLFAPVNYIGRFEELDGFIKDFNQYLAFDKWSVIRNDAEITFKRASKIKIEKTDSKSELKEDEFLQHEFKEIKLETIGLDGTITDILNQRIEEIKKCLNTDAPLSVIFLCGSTLEGLLLGIALKNPKDFNTASSAPKDKEGKVKKLHDWTLNNFINTAHELKLIKEDVKKFSHSLRDFRNYIHPYEHMSSGFNPDKHTAKISWQVLKAAILQLGK
ncbi:MAG: hypothetical protein GY834_01510 [Bacteroidetes bacterium]|nr:hypothetical protein [Bacteroidota bacterium]